jgi:RNA polymerase sigma-70 factor (ECF subfamily)
MDEFGDDLVALLPRLRAYARLLTGGDAAFADDLVQETCERALRGRAGFAEGSSLRAWLYTILKNAHISAVRRRRVRVEAGAADVEAAASVPAPQRGRLEVIAFARAFAALRLDEREAITLSVIHGLAYDEIARVCGGAPGSVKSRISRARAKLRRELDPDAPAPRPEREGAALAPSHGNAGPGT